MIIFSPTAAKSKTELGVLGISQNVRKVLKSANIGIFSGKKPQEQDVKSTLEKRGSGMNLNEDLFGLDTLEAPDQSAPPEQIQ